MPGGKDTAVQKVGQTLRIRESAKEDYRYYHDHLWPEVKQALLEAGVRNYSIFNYGCWLFSYFELPEGVTIEDVGRLASHNEVCRRWEQLMRGLLEPLPESLGDDWWVTMERVWDIDDESNDEIELGQIVVDSGYLYSTSLVSK